MGIKRNTAILAVLIALALAVPVFAGNPLDKAALVEKGATIGGLAYTPQCLGKCALVIEIKPNALADMGKGAADSFKSDFSSGLADKSDCILNSHYEIWANKSYSVHVPDVKCTDSKAFNATTGKDDTITTCIDSGKDETRYRMAWLPIEQAKPTRTGETYYVALIAERKVTPECRHIDAVPTIYGQKLPQFSWWDGNWLYKRPGTIQAPAGISLPLNYTAGITTDMSGWTTLANCDDVRVISAAGAELDRNITNCGGTAALIEFKLPSEVLGGQNYTVDIYYNNPAAGAAPNAKGNIYHYYGDFDGTYGAANDFTWQDGVDSLTVADGYLKFNGANNADSMIAKDVSVVGGNGNYTTTARLNGTFVGDYGGLEVRVNSSTFASNEIHVWYHGTYAPIGLQIGQHKATAASVLNTTAIGDAVGGVFYEFRSDVFQSETWGQMKNATGTTYVYGIDTSPGVARQASGSGIVQSSTADSELWVDWITIKGFVTPTPATAVFAEEIDIPVWMLIYGNTTNGWTFHSGQLFSTNITAVNNTATTSVSEVYVEFNGANHTATNFGGGIYNWNTTLSGVPSGTYTIRQYARNDTYAWLANTSNYFDIAVSNGLNLSAFNAGNGSAIASWNVFITNGTAASDYIGTGKTNPTFLADNQIPQGNIQIKFYNGIFKNSTVYSTSMNSTTYYALNGYMSRYQQFKANSTLGTGITPFSITATNGTANYGSSTTTGTIVVGLDELPKGTVVFTTSASGFVPNSTTITISGSSEINRTEILSYAGIALQAYDEVSGASMPYNVTISNSTATWTLSEGTATDIIYFINSSLPQGDITLAATAYGYGGRTYYLNNNEHAFTNLSIWLLSTASGSYVRFHTLTVSDTGIAGALVQANRTIGGNNILVAEQLTDGTGTALMFLDPLATYTIMASKTGYSTVVASIQPSASDYKLYLSGGTANASIGTDFWDIVWSITPQTCALWNTSAQLFNYSVVSSNNSLSQFGINVTINSTQIWSNISNNPSGGYLNATLNLSQYKSGTITITYWFIKTGYPIYIVNNTCGMTAIGQSNLWGLLTGLVPTLCPMPTDVRGIHWCLPLNFLALLVAGLVGGFSASKFSIQGGGIAAAAVLWLFVFISWFPYQIAFLLTLLVGGVYVIRGGLS